MWLSILFFLPFFFGLPFFIILVGHPLLKILTITFSFNLDMLLNIWVFWAFLPFGFLTVFSSIIDHGNVTYPQCEMWSLSGFFYERKFIQAKKETTRNIFILECERDNKDVFFSHFKRKQLKPINFNLV